MYAAVVEPGKIAQVLGLRRKVTSVEQLGREKVGLSRSRTDQKLILIYRVSKGVTINRFTIGNVSICVFDPMLPLTMDQR